MDFFIRWIFGVEDDDEVVNSNVIEAPQDVVQAPPNAVDQPLDRAVGFKITAEDFGKFDGKPEHWYGFRNKMLSTLGVAGFSPSLIRQRLLWMLKGTVTSITCLKGQRMKVRLRILSSIIGLLWMAVCGIPGVRTSAHWDMDY